MKNVNDIPDFPSHEALHKHLDGKLSVNEAKEMENLIQDDEFFSDAFEGYKFDAPSVAEIESLKSAVNTKVIGQAFNYYFLSTFIISILFYFAIVGFVETTTTHIEKQNVSETKAILDNFFEKPVSIALSEVDTNMVVPENLNNANKVVEPELVTNAKHYNKIETVKPIYVKGLGQTKIEKRLSPILNNNNAPVKYISDILVVDYTKVKGRKNGSEKPLLSVPAYSEKKKYINDGATVMKVNTNELLENAINNFSNGNYTVTLKYLNQLEEIYPKDLNVLFYKGMSYYKLNKVKKAIQYFDKSIKGEFTTFQQDAMWYKAQSFLYSGEKKAAIEVLNDLVASDGYYTKEAEKTLQALNE